MPSGAKPSYPSVPGSPRFPRIEQEVLASWAAQKTFEASVDRRSEDDEFVFYDGPPFANGLPHYGHLLTGYVKDVIPRYRTMRGQRVERRFGWDCHGLPAETEAERGARRLGARTDHRVRYRQIQRPLQDLGAPLHARVGALRHAPSPLGRLRERLQDDGPLVHGERHVGLEDPVGKGPALRGLPGPPLLLGVRDAPVELRDPPGRRLSRPAGSGRHGRLPARPDPERAGGSWPGRSTSGSGRRPPGHCLPTWPWRSGADIDYAVYDLDGARVVLADSVAPSYETSSRAPSCSGRSGARPRRPALPAAVSLLRRAPQRVRRARRAIRDHRGGDRRGPPGPGIRRGRSGGLRGGGHPAGLPGGRPDPFHRGGSRLRGHAGVRGEPAGHQGPSRPAVCW